MDTKTVEFVYAVKCFLLMGNIIETGGKERFCKCPFHLNSSLIFASEILMNSSPCLSTRKDCFLDQVRDDRGDAADV